MFKKLGKKVLPIIMATMLVASMGAVGVSAVETATEESTVVAQATGESTTYTDEITGIKLESSDVDLQKADIYTVDFDSDFILGVSLCENMFDIEVYTEDFEDIDFTENTITASIPCERDDCYVIYNDYLASEPVQLEAEYVDGYYKVRMPGVGSYIISEKPLAEGKGELIEQTLVDEKTGVSAKGMIPTDSQLVVIDYAELIKEFITELAGEDMADVEISEDDLAMLDKIDCYMIYVVRNFNIAETQGEITISLPNENEGFEVRHIFDIPSDSMLGDSISSALELIEHELGEPTMSDEELAQEINSLIDSIMPVIASEYIEGNYVVNEENPGYFIVAPQDSVYATAEDVKLMREEYASNLEEPTEAPTQVATDAPTQAPTQVPTQASTQAPTQTTTNATTSTTQGKGTVNTSNSSNIPMLLSIIGVATATMVAFKKRIAK